ncbi:MAG: hypothetical protein HKP48_06605 [Winogradskyella sp.]|uniref:hypothetical protein n=1 Tax=Winogradskyella sp. TaxID=1883156 RepID=UPI001830F693|nr:hypothetical protein [Winogradskyella sp.]MBT8243634.1 hypothetical protein [Winogradskyella sp.]NNK22959.1 hypothetical protein [Winogradskyella sp.]
MKKLAFVLAVAILSSFNISAQKQSEKELYVKVKDDKKPLIIVNGKKFDFSMDLIDQSKIESVNVLKGDEAKALYNTNNGVILITTKVNNKMDVSLTKETSKNFEKPTIIIDGKIADQSVLQTIDVNKIEKMEVIKGEKAIKKYNSPGGVIILTIKKQ